MRRSASSGQDDVVGGPDHVSAADAAAKICKTLEKADRNHERLIVPRLILASHVADLNTALVSGYHPRPVVRILPLKPCSCATEKKLLSALNEAANANGD